jgi:glycosyltransferase involved in cell wall biosynthesis
VQILHIYKDYAPILGGIENHVRLLAEGQAALGHRVSVLVTNPAGAATTVREEHGVRVVRAGRLATVASTPLSIALPWQLFRQHPDIVHLHLPYPVGDTSQLALHRGRHTVITYHSDIVRQKSLLRFYAPLLRRSLARADRIIATSPRYIETSSFLRPVAGKCVVIPLGIDLERFTAPGNAGDAAHLRGEYGAPLVLFVGQLRYYKGVEYLVRAMADVPGSLVIAGSASPAHRAELLELARACGVAGRVFVVGQKSEAELAPLYHAADVFVLPSIERSEAFGIVQIEAMASGVPVVSTELGTGTSYINQDGVTGFVVPPGDPEALSGAVNRLVSDTVLRESMGGAARARAIAEFPADVMVRRVLEAYQMPT